MFDFIRGALAVVGAVVIVFLIISAFKEFKDWMCAANLRRKMLIDSANNHRDKIVQLEQRLDRLNQEIEFLQGEMAELQPKKAKSK